MRIRIIQHSPLNTLGTIEEYAKMKNHFVESTRFYEIKSSLSIDSFDLLIIMGGPMGVYNYKEYPWLKKEKEFIKQTIEAEKPVLGICLGAQLLADILEARVYENRYTEMGWFPIKAVSKAALQRGQLQEETEFLKGLPEQITVFHWHSQTFDIPGDAIQLYESEGCKNQGFIYKDRVVGLQFHPEVTEERVESLIERFGNLMGDGPFVQDKKEMLGQKEYLAGTKKFMFLILDKFEKKILKGINI
ncbi:MAG: type 1 glutamine amidotransferase [Methanosarcina sp.]